MPFIVLTGAKGFDWGSEMPDMQNCEQLLVVCGSLRTSSPLVLQQVCGGGFWSVSFSVPTLNKCLSSLIGCLFVCF